MLQLFKPSSSTLLSPNINDFNEKIQIKEDRTSTPIKDNTRKSQSSSEDEEFFKTKKKTQNLNPIFKILLIINCFLKKKKNVK